MVSVASVSQSAIALEYVCQRNLDLYDSPECERLATQAAAGRHLKLVRSPQATAVEVRLCEDDYPCWLSLADLETLTEATAPYQAVARSRSEIEAKLPEAIAFTQAAMQHPNDYLWGGTVGPNYDCSGLMQAAFASVGIWLPRDAYQQEAFTEPVSLETLEPGDLIFFGTPEKATHVALYLGEGRYIHSSGKTQGRNGIAIDPLCDRGDAVVQAYFKQLRGAGRVVCSYCPT
ncbi:NlpC/P60 family protein [Oscillatoria amoena NRMC-F 0135]|nr:NlpC/P60 family protein [Geitlerinema splendidum]MDL5046871.1 NlpC/P60 family protein [Oscillatoria amoena NRMC-F 0135]